MNVQPVFVGLCSAGLVSVGVWHIAAGDVTKKLFEQPRLVRLVGVVLLVLALPCLAWRGLYFDALAIVFAASGALRLITPTWNIRLQQALYPRWVHGWVMLTGGGLSSLLYWRPTVLRDALSCWPRPDGWTLVGFILTVLGFLVGAFALWLTWKIYQWTDQGDDVRQAQLLDALKTYSTSYKELAAGQAPVRADLGRLSAPEQAKLQALLRPDEIIVRLERSESGKGNHPWQAVTSDGRLLQVYRGGRLGGVHAREIIS